MDNLFYRAGQALICSDPSSKIEQINQLYFDLHPPVEADPAAGLHALRLDLTPQMHALLPAETPGHPPFPALVHPKYVPKRGLGTPLGRAALLHAIAHIEFNAMNLALDAIHRFQDLPLEYYQDWAKVGYEEARHFSLLADELLRLGYSYGHFTAHNGLWDMAVLTQSSALTRMALVPRLMEARGLDVTPQIIERLRAGKEHRAVEILEIILKEEVGHVRVGNRWYHYLCTKEGVDPVETFVSLLRQHAPKGIRRPIDVDRRRQAGFTEEELSLIQTLADL